MGDRLSKIVIAALLVVLAVYVAQPYVDRWMFSASTPRAVEARGSVSDIERMTIEIFERASPSVVQVVGRAGVLDAPQLESENGPAQSGTGFVWDAAGHVVTNDHVVEGTGSLAVRFASGQVSPGRLALETFSAGHRATHEIPLTQRPYLLAALKPFIATQQLEEQKDYYFSTFDPATLSQQTTKVVVEARETIRVGDRTEPALRVRQQFKGISVTSWLDGSGRTLKEESPAGLSMTRQSPAQAKELGPARSVSLDLIAQTSIPVAAPITNPERKKFLKLRLSGFDHSGFMLSAGRQQFSGGILEVRREPIETMGSFSLPSQDKRLVSFLQPTPFLQSDNPAIRSLAGEIIGAEKDARKAALRIKDWVYKNIAKKPTISIPNAFEVLQTRKGDCNEHAVLFNALARAAGIPAKTVVGVVHMRGAFYYHAWSEIWLGDWVSLDPVFNQFPADVTHVKFLEGDIDRQIDILRLIGNLKIAVIEAS